MLHIATAHRGTARWIEIQAEHLRRHIAVPFMVWGSLAGLDAAHGASFDRVIGQKGPEHAKLNHLAVEISREADEDDLLMFLDPDAFPIADPMPVIEGALARAPLLAVRRAENFEPQPHPCFCVTSVGTWRALAGDWSDGYPFAGADGRRATAPGANLLRRLELSGTPWVQLLRTNGQRRDPLMFAIYGEVVYHHGGAEIAAADRPRSPRPLPAPPSGAIAAATRRFDAQRLLLWERRLLRRSARRSEQIFRAIAAGSPDWLAQVRD
ncbi:MAG TPA: hypothetical protein VGD00_09310 [Solirubrobacteraceae bacterium]